MATIGPLVLFASERARMEDTIIYNHLVFAGQQACFGEGMLCLCAGHDPRAVPSQGNVCAAGYRLCTRGNREVCSWTQSPRRGLQEVWGPRGPGRRCGIMITNEHVSLSPATVIPATVIQGRHHASSTASIIFGLACIFISATSTARRQDAAEGRDQPRLHPCIVREVRRLCIIFMHR